MNHWITMTGGWWWDVKKHCFTESKLPIRNVSRERDEETHIRKVRIKKLINEGKKPREAYDIMVDAGQLTYEGKTWGPGHFRGVFYAVRKMQ